MTQFEEIYEVYFREVYLYAFALTKDREQAQEITSETFARALEGIDRFRGDCDVRYWLCRIAKNCYTSQLRKDGRLTELPEKLPQEGSVEQNAIDAALSEQAQAALDGRPVPELPPLAERVETALRQFHLAAQDKGEHIACLEARKHFAWYLRGVAHSGYYKEKISSISTVEDVQRLAAGIRRDLR